ncbi:tRNA pseudouridine synthase 1 [Daldinia childiae]|uniref:tRNA pseudouridine synthase 1 n=1 Tax=Daldinia childiae TaxID=326645 RepID=UPI001446709D|nr:tRNA pseudouridine synthase 1 [Daldinia childiae]KAF3059438.1 tRNA pseudouridine synthase 1 [Daldinia childiae]
MVAETDSRNAPTGNSDGNASKPTSSISPNPELQVDSDTTKSNRRDDGNRHADRKLNSNGRRRGQDSKGRGNGRGGESRGPKDKRERNEKGWQERKRRRVDENGNSAVNSDSSYMNIQFPEEEIAAEERRPKRKVSVMIGYAGTGYHGLQINHKEKTIEGDIFAALVAAKAISKANADDPRKSSFVRCARTDKGVHAAGNMISLKLIIEDPDVVKNINDNLPPQIRVWGIQRTNNAFSCYQSCDSRWYEYLMPSYCLLPPHPESFLGKKVLESIKEKGLEEEYAKRLGEVKDYWEEVQKNDIQPILDSLDPSIRETVIRRMHTSEETSNGKNSGEVAEPKSSKKPTDNSLETKDETTETKSNNMPTDASNSIQNASVESSTVAAELASEPTDTLMTGSEDIDESEATKSKEIHPVDRALKQIKAAYVAAKRRYRVTPERLSQLQEALDRYLGTRNFHNYTIQKSHSDPSAKRTIKSFVANPEPVQINDTEWLSLKVHGQSFMMHQIRKMVGMAVLVTRCATPLSRIDESYGTARISIPKAPSLGLLLERPVFENYNKRAREQYNLAELDFGNYEKEIQEFKDSQIYRRIFELEEKENSFHTFFHQIDNYKEGYFLWVTAGGIEVAEQRMGQMESIPKELEEELGDDGEENPDEGEG